MTDKAISSSLKLLDIAEQSRGTDVIDVAKEYEKLSPTTKESLGILLRSISKGEAQLDYDREGKQIIDYKPAKKLLWDGSNANVTAVPKSDADIKNKVDACLELVDFLKSEKPPSGVLLDKTKISLSPGKDYREGREFTKTREVLGSGNSAGDILVVKDTKTGTEHACKTMMISLFRKEEIKCWVDMSDSGYAPCLYYFSINKNKITIHMEMLQDAKTLRSIIDEHMAKFYQDFGAMSLVKPFCLFVLDGALEAVSHMHSQGWAHKDLHGGNVMLQKKNSETLNVKILDFGMASPVESQLGIDFRGFQSDIAQVIRLFSGLYTGMEFDNVYDVRRNWENSLIKKAEYLNMSHEDREELFCLVDAALGIVDPSEVEEYRNLVKERLSKAMGDLPTSTDIMRRVVALLFPEQVTEQLPEASIFGSTTMEHDMADSSVDMGNGTDYNLATESILTTEQRYHDIERSANQITAERIEELRQRISVRKPDLTKH